LNLKESLSNITKIISPIRVIPESQRGIPGSPVSISFSGVSVLTKGTFVSKFLGYLYSLGSMHRTEVIECDYLFPPGFVAMGFIQHSPILGPAWPALKGKSAPRHSQPVSFETTSRSLKDLRDGVEEYLVSVLFATRARPVGFLDRQLVIPARLIQGGTVRHVLMMTVLCIPPLGILVALNQAEEDLRQVRNIHESERET